MYLSPEQTFLLACLSLNPDQEDLVRLLKKPLDWPCLLQLALEHKVLSLVYARLRDLGDTRIPPTVTQQWEPFAKGNHRYNYALTIEMKRLVGRFAAAEFPLIVFKGPTLAVQLYGNIYSRQFADIDFLCAAKDIPRGAELLIEDGYVPENRIPSTLSNLGYHYTFNHSTRNSCVELHWEVAPTYLYFPLRFEAIWKRTTEIEVLGTRLQTPSPDDTLLILAAHGTKHGWMRLSWIYDVAAFVDTYPDLDWPQLLQQAQRLHCQRMLLLGLFLANALLQADLPAPISQAIAQDPQVASLANYVLAWLFAPPNSSHYFENHAFQIKVRDHLRDKYVYVKVKQPFLEKNAPLGAFAWPQVDRGLYYLLWVNRLVRKYAIRPVLRLVERMLPSP